MFFSADALKTGERNPIQRAFLFLHKACLAIIKEISGFQSCSFSCASQSCKYGAYLTTTTTAPRTSQICIFDSEKQQFSFLIFRRRFCSFYDVK